MGLNSSGKGKGRGEMNRGRGRVVCVIGREEKMWRGEKDGGVVKVIGRGSL